MENVTIYEKFPPKEETTTSDAMDVDNDEAPKKAGRSIDEKTSPSSEGLVSGSQQAATSAKSVQAAENKPKPEDIELTMDVLYETFWSLQNFFSQPTKLFDDTNLETFKAGLLATMRKFKSVQRALQSRDAAKAAEGKRGKRKRSSPEDEVTSAFNPKYLTSRDLFELEISDLSFRRNIMVQTLITLDFLLSLSPKAKKKVEHFNNRAVLYNYTISDENIKWAQSARADIAVYLSQGPEGKFYYRMVDTVLSRDKNWTYWKAESCPRISMDSVDADSWAQAVKGIQRSCTNKKLKAQPMGAVDLTFLTKARDNNLASLKDPERYTLPTIESFERPVADDQFEIEMSTSPEEKKVAEDAKASKLWRTLRLASRQSLGFFDKFDDGKNPNAVFRPGEANSPKPADTTEDTKQRKDSETSLPDRRRKSESIEVSANDTVIISSDSGGAAVGDTMQSVSTGEKKEELLESTAGDAPMQDETTEGEEKEPSNEMEDVAVVDAAQAVLSDEKMQEPLAASAEEGSMEGVTLATAKTQELPATVPEEATEEGNKA